MVMGNVREAPYALFGGREAADGCATWSVARARARKAFTQGARGIAECAEASGQNILRRLRFVLQLCW